MIRVEQKKWENSLRFGFLIGSKIHPSNNAGGASGYNQNRHKSCHNLFTVDSVISYISNYIIISTIHTAIAISSVAFTTVGCCSPRVVRARDVDLQDIRIARTCLAGQMSSAGQSVHGHYFTVPLTLSSPIAFSECD